MKLINQTILIISNEPWGDVWFSKQHYANELSENNMVYFVNPPSKWKISNLLSFAVSINKVTDSLIVVTYKNNLPVFSFFKTPARWLNDVCNSYKLKKLIRKTEGQRDIIFWQFDPFRFIHIFFFKKKKRIYHVVDPYMSIDTDKAIALSSNLIISISHKYIEHYKALNKNVILIPHGISRDEQIINKETIDEIRNIFRNFILLIGTINDRIDLPLLKKIATDFTENNLVIIGPTLFGKEENKHLFESLIKLKNVNYLGVVHAKKLNNYIVASQVCILSYYTEENGFCMGTPLKVSNYIAQKKIIISSTFFYDMMELNNKIIFMTSQHDEFINYLKKAIDNNLYYDIKLAEEYIEKTNYTTLIDSIFDNINSKLYIDNLFTFGKSKEMEEEGIVL